MDGASNLVARAMAFARRGHEGQTRASGDPYVVHAEATAAIVTSLGMEETVVAAAYLHDILEETATTPEELAREFGAEVRGLVEALTNMRRLEFASEAEYERVNLTRMFLAMAGDVRVVILKIADRLDNLRSLEALPPERRRRYARETLGLFAPLADRLGLAHIRWEMEDLAFRHLEPERYRELARAVAGRRAAREQRVREIGSELRALLAEAGVEAEVVGRAKNLYSIWRKLTADGRSFGDVYDLIGFRVIAADVEGCYRALDAIHSFYAAVGGRYKDFIVRPKANLYQSIHTTVRLAPGEAVEIQIRTPEMDAVAEYGVAAHWLYKKAPPDKDWGDYPALRLLRAALGGMGKRPPLSRLEAFLADLPREDVFVFTPKGEVKRLPRGATPVDFAFAVHSAVGHRCAGAKVNRRLVPLKTVLETGDVVEVITSPSQTPRRDWLEFVASLSARHKIRAFFRRRDREELIALGRAALAREWERRRLAALPPLDDTLLAESTAARGLASVEELLMRIGEGALSAAAVANAALPPPAVIPPELVGLPDYSPYVALAGGGRMEVNMAGCCRPTPPGPIAGYVTNRGVVSIHRAECAVVRRGAAKGRRVDACWQFDEEEAARGAALELALADEGRWLPEILRRVKRSGLRIVGVNVGPGGGVRPITVHVRLATGARTRRALQDIRALAAVTDARFSFFKG